MELRVLTLNLQGLGADWFAQRRDRLLPQLEAAAPDLLCLQEVGIRETPFYHQALDLGRHLGMVAVAYAPYGNPEEVTSPVQGGVAVVARWPMQLIENRRLPPGARHPDNRVALMVSAMHPQRPLHLAVTHLSWPPAETEHRVQQIATILTRAREYGWLDPGQRFLLAGDLNAPPDEPGLSLLRTHLTDAWSAVHPDAPGHTWSHTNPLTGGYPLPSRRLDYCFVDSGATVRSARVVFDDPDAGFVSDHFGLLVTLSWDDRLGS